MELLSRDSKPAFAESKARQMQRRLQKALPFGTFACTSNTARHGEWQLYCTDHKKHSDCPASHCATACCISSVLSTAAVSLLEMIVQMEGCELEDPWVSLYQRDPILLVCLNDAMIEKLDLSKCDLCEVPTALTTLVNLSTLNLSHNSLTTLPRSLSALTSLTSLQLAANPLEPHLALMLLKVRLHGLAGGSRVPAASCCLLACHCHWQHHESPVAFVSQLPPVPCWPGTATGIVNLQWLACPSFLLLLAGLALPLAAS